MRALILCGFLVAALGCHRAAPSRAGWDATTAAAIAALRADSSPYRIIYYPAVDLAKKPAPPP